MENHDRPRPEWKPRVEEESKRCLKLVVIDVSELLTCRVFYRRMKARVVAMKSEGEKKNEPLKNRAVFNFSYRR